VLLAERSGGLPRPTERPKLLHALHHRNLSTRQLALDLHSGSTYNGRFDPDSGNVAAWE